MKALLLTMNLISLPAHAQMTGDLSSLITSLNAQPGIFTAFFTGKIDDVGAVRLPGDCRKYESRRFSKIFADAFQRLIVREFETQGAGVNIVQTQKILGTRELEMAHINDELMRRMGYQSYSYIRSDLQTVMTTSDGTVLRVQFRSLGGRHGDLWSILNPGWDTLYESEEFNIGFGTYPSAQGPVCTVTPVVTRIVVYKDATGEVVKRWGSPGP